MPTPSPSDYSGSESSPSMIAPPSPVGDIHPSIQGSGAGNPLPTKPRTDCDLSIGGGIVHKTKTPRPEANGRQKRRKRLQPPTNVVSPTIMAQSHPINVNIDAMDSDRYAAPIMSSDEKPPLEAESAGPRLVREIGSIIAGGR